MKIIIFTDGGSRGNPGVAGAGVVVFSETGKMVFQESKSLGIKTNNEAEYAGLISALEWVHKNRKEQNIDGVEIKSDSQLLVRQMTGQYKVKAKNLKELWMRARRLYQEVNIDIRFTEIGREENGKADELANEAMDMRL